MEVQNGDFLFFSPEYRSDPFEMNLVTDEDFSEPTSILSASPPSSPEFVPFVTDSLLSTDPRPGGDLGGPI